jgi:hypothetical protein
MEKPKININLEQTTELKCEKCQGTIFNEGVMLRKASKFLTGSTQDSLIPVGCFYCVSCKHVNEDLLPLEMRKK